MSERTAAILLFEGFEELDAIGPYDVLSTAARNGADLSVDLVTVDGADEVTASEGLRVVPDRQLRDTPDYLIVPGGGGWGPDADEGVWTASKRDDILDAIVDNHEAGAVVASVCTGAMLLASAGLLDGRPATTHASVHEDLAATDAELVRARVVDDGDVLSAGGVTAGIDLALSLVEREWGSDVADAVSTSLEHERSTDVYQG